MNCLNCRHHEICKYSKDASKLEEIIAKNVDSVNKEVFTINIKCKYADEYPTIKYRDTTLDNFNTYSGSSSPTLSYTYFDNTTAKHFDGPICINESETK